jgi:hypothetical protein
LEFWKSERLILGGGLPCINQGKAKKLCRTPGKKFANFAENLARANGIRGYKKQSPPPEL